MRTIVQEPGKERIVYQTPVHAFGIIVALEQERGVGTHQDGPGHPGAAVTCEIARDHATAQGPTGQGEIIQVQALDEYRQVIGERGKVVALTGMIGSSTTPLIVRNATYAPGDERRYLILPHGCADGPSVNEEKGPTRAPIRIVQTRSIMDFDKWHSDSHLGLHDWIFSLAP